jgi:hypothetical protein
MIATTSAVGSRIKLLESVDPPRHVQGIDRILDAPGELALEASGHDE